MRSSLAQKIPEGLSVIADPRLEWGKEVPSTLETTGLRREQETIVLDRGQDWQRVIRAAVVVISATTTQQELGVELWFVIRFE